MAFGYGIDPADMLKMVQQALHPDLAGFLVPMLNGPAGIDNFVWRHGGVANKNQLPIRAIGVDQLPSGNVLSMAAAVVSPDLFVHAIVEIKTFQILKFRPSGGE